jgi:hypothetical protein
MKLLQKSRRAIEDPSLAALSMANDTSRRIAMRALEKTI